MYALPVGEAIPEETLKRLLHVSKNSRMPMIFIINEFEDSQCINHFETGFGPPDFLEAVKNNTEASGEMIE